MNEILYFLKFKWLQKQAEGRKLTELPDDLKDLTDDEKNLDYLKEKARFDLILNMERNN